MIDLTKKVLPSAVMVEGFYFDIKTDFHYWIIFNKLIKDTKARFIDFDFLYKNEKPQNRMAGVQALIDFAYPPRLLPRPTSGDNERINVVDFEIDADLIYSAFMSQYKIDLVESSMHWYKFKTLFDGLKDNKLNEVMSYRSYTKSSKTYEKSMQELKAAWEISTEMTLTEEEQKALDRFNAIADGKKNDYKSIGENK